MILNRKILLAITIAAAACGKKKADDDAAATTDAPPVSNLSAVPDAQLFLASNPKTSLTLGSSSNAIVGTAPFFKDVSGNLATYLTGDTTTLAAQIKANRDASNWTAMKAQFDGFFQAQSKCQLMEATARIASRLTEDTSTLCVLKGMGQNGKDVFQVVSGAAIADLTTVFAASDADKVLSIATPGDDSGASKIIFQIPSTTNPANKGYNLTMTMCDANGKPTQQNIVLIDNSAKTMSFTSKRQDKEGGNTRSANFVLTGSLTSDGKGGVIPDATKDRKVTYANVGTFGTMSSSNQGSLTVTSDSILNAIFISTHSGKDQNANDMSNAQKNAISVAFSGTKLSDMVIKEGAGKDQSTFTGKFGDGAAGTNTHSGTIAFSFDNTKSPQYTTQTASSFLTTVNAVDFTTDPILKQTAPAAPDVTMDATACTATITTSLKMASGAKSTVDGVMKSCNEHPNKNNGNMCEGLRNSQQVINDAVNTRKKATGNDEKS